MNVSSLNSSEDKPANSHCPPRVMENEHLVFLEAPDGIFLLDRNYHLRDVNPSGCRMLGYSRDEVPGLSWPDIVARNETEGFRFEDLLGEQNVLQELSLVCKSGSLLPVEMNLRLLPDGSVMGIARHRGDRYQVESEKARRLYKLISENVGDVIWLLDWKMRRFTYVSPSVEKLRGFTPEEVMQQSLEEVLLPESLHMILDLMPERLREFAAGNENARVATSRVDQLHKNGSVIHTEVVTTLLTDEHGQVNEILGVSRDIGDRLRMETASREHEDRMRSIISHSPFGAHLFELMPDQRLIFREANSIADRILGIDHVSFVGKTMEEAFPPLASTELPEAYRRVVREGKSFDKEVLEYSTDKGITGAFDIHAFQAGPQHVAAFFSDITERKRMEEHLRLTQFSVDSASIGIFRVGMDARIIGVNDQACRVLGYTRDELCSMTVFDIDPNFSSANWTEHRKGVRALGSKTFETVHRRKDGTRIPMEITVNYLHYKGQEFSVSFARDITERKQAEHALHESEYLLKKAQDVARLGTYVLDVLNGVWTSSPTLDEIFGITDSFPKTVEGWLQIVAPEDLEKTLHHLNDHVLAGRNRFEMEYRIRRINDREERWVSGMGELDLDACGNPIRMIGTIQDITPRKMAEEALRESEERFRATLYSIGDGVITTDTSARVQQMNPLAEALTGWKEADALGRPIQEVFFVRSEATGDPVENPVERVLAEGVVVGLATHALLISKDGTKRPIADSGAPIHNANGDTTGVVLVFNDQTEMRELQIQLLQAQKMESLGTLAGGIAHDFNNILAIILGHASLLDRVSTDAGRVRRSAEAIAKASTRGASLVRQLLTFARKTEPVISQVRPNEIVQELLRLLSETFPKSISITTNLVPELPLIAADATQLHQVLLNLCVNARDAMSNTGSLSISTSLIAGESLFVRYPSAIAREYVQIDVADTGSGMDATTLARVFEPFFTTKEPGQGTGLGLSVAFGIMKSHNGFVDVESEIGRGTVFHLYLPVPAHHDLAEQSSSPDAATFSRGKETILIIEDEVMLSEMVTSLLTDLGYNVLTASDGIEGLELFRRNQEKIDAVLTDIGLPGMSGDEVVKRLLQMNPSLKILIASGYIEPGVKSETMATGVKAYIAKPYTLAHVAGIIRQVLDAE